MASQTGLANLGATCFLNTGIQCLRHSRLVREHLSSFNEEDLKISVEVNKIILFGTPEDKMKLSGKRIDNINLYLAFKKTLKDLQESSTYIAPRDLLAFGRTYSAHVGMEHLFSGQQCDIQEFITFIIDAIHESKAKHSEMTISPRIIGTMEEKIMFDGLTMFKKYFGEKYSWVIKHFFYLIIGFIKCVNCNYISFSYDPSNVLCLPIPKKRADSASCDMNLYDCMDHYFGKEILTDSASWKCDKCANTCGNFKEYKLLSSPSILIIVIKRFNFNGVWKKNGEIVQFPIILNIAKYKIGSEKRDCNYRLFAVANHVGSMGGGHYFAYCCDLENAEMPWYEFNDERVSRINESSIYTPNSYMLFYQLVPDLE